MSELDQIAEEAAAELARDIAGKRQSRFVPIGGILGSPPQTDAPTGSTVTSTDILKGINTGADIGLPLGGAMLGGAIGIGSTPIMGPASPLATAGLSGGGAALGQQGANVINEIIAAIDPQAAVPRGATGNLLRTGASGIGGASGELGFQALLGTVKKFLQRSLRPEEVQMLADAAKHGIRVLGNEITGLTGQSALTGYPQKFPLGSGPMVKAAQRRAKETQGAVERLGQQFGPRTDLQAAGRTIKTQMESVDQAQTEAAEEAVTRFIQSFGRPRSTAELGAVAGTNISVREEARRKAIGTIYDRFGHEMGDRTIQATNLHRTTSEMAEFEDKLRGVKTRIGTVAAGLKSATGPKRTAEEMGLNQLAKSESGQDFVLDMIRSLKLDQLRDMDFPTLRAMQERLGALGRSVRDDDTKRRLGLLFKAVSKDIDVMAAGNPTLRRANHLYGEHVAPYFTRRQYLRGLRDEPDPTRVGEALLTVGTPQQARQILQHLPVNTAESWRATLIERLHDAGINPLTNEFSPSLFLRAAGRRYDPETLQTILGARKYDEFRQLANSFHRTPGDIEPLFGQIARTDEHKVLGTFLQKNASNDVEAVFRHLDEPAKQQARSAAVGKLIQDAIDPQTRQFSLQKFLSSTEHIDPATWKAFLGDKAADDMTSLIRVLNRIQQETRIGANPSQTAHGMMAWTQIGGAMALGTSTAMGKEDVGSFTAKGLILLHPWMLAKLLTSDRGIKLLSQGLTIKPGTEAAMRLGSQIGALVTGRIAE